MLLLTWFLGRQVSDRTSYAVLAKTFGYNCRCFTFFYDKALIEHLKMFSESYNGSVYKIASQDDYSKYYKYAILPGIKDSFVSKTEKELAKGINTEMIPAAKQIGTEQGKGMKKRWLGSTVCRQKCKH